MAGELLVCPMSKRNTVTRDIRAGSQRQQAPRSGGAALGREPGGEKKMVIEPTPSRDGSWRQHTQTAKICDRIPLRNSGLSLVCQGSSPDPVHRVQRTAINELWRRCGRAGWGQQAYLGRIHLGSIKGGTDPQGSQELAAWTFPHAPQSKLNLTGLAGTRGARGGGGGGEAGAD